jgi:type VI secretion system secreted protein Hcp
MAIHMFMQIDTIKGESTDNKYKDQIELNGWSWGAAQTGNSSTGKGSSIGKSSVTDLTYTAPVDRSVPTLLQYLLSGKPFSKAILTICKSTGAAPIPYLTVTMTTGLISNLTFAGSPSDEMQTVTVSLNFQQVNLQYTPQGNDGQPGGAVSMGWNLATASAV